MAEHDHEDLMSREDRLAEMLKGSLGATMGVEATEETGVDPESPPAEEVSPDEPDGSDTSPREEVQPEVQDGGEQRVPFDRFAQVNKEKNSYKTELEAEKSRRAEMEKELAELRKRDRDRSLEESFSEENLPKGFEDWSFAKQQAYLQDKAVAELRAETQARMDALEARLAAPSEVADRLQISEDIGESLTSDQFAEIKAIKAANPGLTSRQLLLLAKDKNPELFQGPGAGRPPANTQVTPPRPSGVGAGGTRRDPDHVDLDEMLSKARTGDEREQAALAWTKQNLLQ